jgi:hypothetical protein
VPQTVPKTVLGSQDKDQGGPLLILALDEANALVNMESKKARWSHFNESRHILWALQPQSCFALFMSTTGQISQFVCAREEDSSLRILSGDLTQIPPFTNLSLDMLAQKVSLNCGWDLERVTTHAHMAHLG